MKTILIGRSAALAALAALTLSACDREEAVVADPPVVPAAPVTTAPPVVDPAAPPTAVIVTPPVTVDPATGAGTTMGAGTDPGTTPMQTTPMGTTPTQ